MQVDIAADIARIISKPFADEVRANVSDTKTHDPSYYGGIYGVQPTPGTTHISAMDETGLAVSMTSTVNLVWGSKIMTRSGIIMNNQMDDFSTPNTTNAFGLKASPNNFIRAWPRRERYERPGHPTHDVVQCIKTGFRAGRGGTVRDGA